MAVSTSQGTSLLPERTPIRSHPNTSLSLQEVVVPVLKQAVGGSRSEFGQTWSLTQLCSLSAKAGLFWGHCFLTCKAGGVNSVSSGFNEFTHGRCSELCLAQAKRTCRKVQPSRSPEGSLSAATCPWAVSSAVPSTCGPL